MIILAFDFGTKKIGVAVGENVTNTGRALSILSAKNGNPDWKLVKILIINWEPKYIIVGLPLNIDGTNQNITKKAKKFAYLLKRKFDIPVKLHDERLSTVEARSIIFNKGGFQALQKKQIDSMAAVIILESWLSQNHIN